MSCTAGGWTRQKHSIDEEAMADWAVDPNFAEVQATELRDSLWRTVRQGSWQYKQHIMILEARAALKGVERLVCGVHGKDIQQLFLLGNMSLVLCLVGEDLETLRF